MPVPYILAGASLLGGLAQGFMGSSASRRQARAIREAAQLRLQGLRETLRQQRELFEEGKGAITTYGERGVGVLEGLAGLGTEAGSRLLAEVDAFTNPLESDLFKIQAEDLERSVLRSKARLGGLASSDTLRALTEGRRRLAASEVDRAFTRRVNILNTLFGTGANAQGRQATLIAGIGTGIGQLAGQTSGQVGLTAASGYGGAANLYAEAAQQQPLDAWAEAFRGTMGNLAFLSGLYNQGGGGGTPQRSGFTISLPTTGYSLGARPLDVDRLLLSQIP